MIWVTYGEVLRLPNSTRILLLNGHEGRIVSWHHTSEAVSVEDGAQRLIVPCRALRRRGDGTVAEVVPE